MLRPDEGMASQAEPDRPKTLGEPGAAEARRALLDLPRMAALRPLVDAIRAGHGEVPDPDPLDGGADARLLLLLETPGPRIRATGFVSRDNPAETSANLFRECRAAGIARRDTLIWNAVPWIVHAPGATNRAPRAGELAAGRRWIPPLLGCLPRLAVVVLAGRAAADAAEAVAAARPGLPVLRMPHPSPTYLCTSPAHPARVRACLAEAAAILSGRG